jgi:lipopolysaccharide transport system ATP-binding protein
MSEAVITFDHVSKSYPYYQHITGGLKNFLFNLPQAVKKIKTTRFVSLHDISFEVRRGETFGIIGRNGAGKSTTLGLIAGVLKPTAGKVSVRGRISPMLELGAGFHPELTGRENIFLNGVLMGMTRREVAAHAQEIIEFSELGEFIDQPIRVYSSGMLARLGFSVVSSLDPEILLIDEILAVGDLNFVHKCLDRMLAFKTRGVTMVLVSHMLEDIKNLCTRVLWIDNHQIKMIGDPTEVVAAYAGS